MDKIHRVTYILGGITWRTDDFCTMADGTVESAVQAIQEKFHGVWGFDPEAIEIKAIIPGHYERRPVTCRMITRYPRVFVAELEDGAMTLPDSLRSAAIENPTHENLMRLGGWLELFGDYLRMGHYWDIGGYLVYPMGSEPDDEDGPMVTIGYKLRRF